MNYDSLIADVQSYAEKSDAEFVDQIPRFVMLAETRIASEARGLGLMLPVTNTLSVGTSVLQKPAQWRETVSFCIGTSTGFNTRVYLRLRPYEYCRAYAPDPTQQSQPKYYADYDYEDWLIAPSPALAHPFEIIYHQRPTPLDDANQTNWTTKYAPQLILYAALLESQYWLKQDARVPVFQKEYDRALAQVAFEQKRRLEDRSMMVQSA